MSFDALRAMHATPPAFPQEVARSPRNGANWILIGVFCLTCTFSALMVQALLAGMTERYCIIWPGIGTHFAAGYTERGFARIQRGMSKQQVQQLIGQPLSTGHNCAPSGWDRLEPDDETWTYSSDGSSHQGGDWAWLSREVVFRSGRVTQTVRWIYYD